MTLNDLPVTASCGMTIAPTKPLCDMDQYDYVVLAGGLLSETRHPPEWLLVLLRDLHAAKIPIIALCSASFVLGKAGLLDGRECAVHFTAWEEFVERFPKALAVTDENFIAEGDIITCSGGTAIELAARLISRHCGALRAQKGLEYLMVKEKAIRQHTASGDRSPSSEFHVYKDKLIERAINYMRSNMDSPGCLRTLAKQLGVHERQLHRAFLNCARATPSQYWRGLRLNYAKELLVNTSYHVTQVASLTGFSDSSHFTLWFRKTFGETPASFRKRRRDVDRLVGFST